jgi:lipopolysaccharide/colanic/teichoic acid biosynthesis glycosyltransferase
MGDLLPLDGDDIDLRDAVWAGEPRSAAVKVEPAVQPLAAHRSTYARVIKPLGDRLLALVLVIFLAPLMLAIAVGVRITLGRPVLYRQVRMGKDGRTFVLWKFRTMLPDRRQRRVPVKVDLRVCHKRQDDPRHVPFGTFLRRTSLDELPQLLNVLAGHMSLVGPRPELVELVERYEPWQHQRHVVKPGLTGLWQVSVRGEGMMHDNVHLDLEYLKTLSLRTDLRILLRTPRVLLVRSGS